MKRSRDVWLRAVSALGLELQWLEVVDAADFDAAFERASRGRAQGLYAPATNLIVTYRRRIAELAQRERLPSVSDFPLLAEAGFMRSYGADLEVLGRRAVVYIDKILRGAHPGELPIERPTRFELVVNLKAARAIGLTLPAATLQRADRLIE